MRIAALIFVVVALSAAALATTWTNVSSSALLSAPVLAGATVTARATLPAGYRAYSGVTLTGDAIGRFSIVEQSQAGSVLTVRAQNTSSVTVRFSALVGYALPSDDEIATIKDDATLAHEGTPHGINNTYAWYSGPAISAGMIPPAGWTSVLPLANVYVDATGIAPANTRVEIGSIELREFDWTDRAWHILSYTPGNAIDGAWYFENADTVGNGHVASDLRDDDNGYASATAGAGSSAGRAFRFYPFTRSLNVTQPGAALTTVWARLILDDAGAADDRASSTYMVCPSADYWIDQSSPFAGLNVNNRRIGIGRCGYVPRDGSWRAFHMLSMPAASVATYTPQVWAALADSECRWSSGTLYERLYPDGRVAWCAAGACSIPLNDAWGCPGGGGYAP